MEKFRLLFATSRPISWVNTAYPFAAGYLVTGGSPDSTFWVATIFFLIPYNLLMYGVNDVFDYESDIRNPRKGGVEGAITAKKYHSLILWASGITTVPFVGVLLAMGSFVAAVTLLAVVFFVVAYSLKGLRFKEVPFLDSATSSMHFVGPLLFALALHGFPAAAWPYVIAFFLWGVASHAFGAVQDVVPDREAKIHSIATVLGARKTVWLALLCYLAASTTVAVQGGVSVIVGFTGLLYAASVMPFLHITDERSAQARAGWKRFLWLNYVAGAVITMCLITVTR
jgi:4-hydroxybenzoate polyprenyltransferase